MLFWNFAATNTCISPNKNVNFLLYNCIKTAILMCTQMKYEWCLIRFSFPTLCWNGNVMHLNFDAKYCIISCLRYIKLFSCYLVCNYDVKLNKKYLKSYNFNRIWILISQFINFHPFCVSNGCIKVKTQVDFSLLFFWLKILNK